MIKTTLGKAWWTNFDEYYTMLKIHGRESTSITTKLAFVKRRGETKFQWVVLPNSNREDWPVKTMQQGVTFSLEAAKKKVESFWPVGSLVDVKA